MIEGRELVDGGFVDKVPVEVAFRLGADVVIHPDVTSVHWADFAAIESIIPMGEAAGTEALPAIRAALKAGRPKALARFLGFDRKWSVSLRQP